MIKHWTIRLLVGLTCGLSLALFTIMVTQAQTTEQVADPLPDDCGECHEVIVANAEASPHGQAFADPAFQEMWAEKGSPDECLACHTTGYDEATHTWEEEGVGCATCHEMGSNSTHHPEQVMPVDRSSEACGTCHVDTHEDWAISEHGQEEMACVNCHNPHTADLKKESVEEVCIDCHNEEAYFYAYTGHSQEGMICTDCHLQVSETELGNGHAKRVHTFAVDLNTCNSCHEQEMHSMNQSIVSGATMAGSMGNMTTEGEDDETGVTPCESLDTIQRARNDIIFPEEVHQQEALAPDTPTQSAPLSFLIAIGFGLILGVIGTPFVERAYRKVSK
jgi:predicted CXXCH cytochrome family protein